MTEKRDVLRIDWSLQIPIYRPPCPECGGKEVLPILYGMPPAEIGEAAERGQVVLGGCVITGDDPNWRCAVCGHQWR